MTPNWHVPPEISDPNELDAIAKEVNAEVLSNPSFEQVTGISAELTVMHALRVVEQYQAMQRGAIEAPQLVHLYMLGFVVGIRWQRSKGEQSCPPSDE